MIVIVGLILAFVLLLIFSRPATRLCRWRRSQKGAETQWTCAYCGAVVRSASAKPPTQCHRTGRDA